MIYNLQFSIIFFHLLHQTRSWPIYGSRRICNFTLKYNRSKSRRWGFVRMQSDQFERTYHTFCSIECLWYDYLIHINKIYLNNFIENYFFIKKGPPYIRSMNSVRGVTGSEVTILCPFYGYPIR